MVAPDLSGMVTQNDVVCDPRQARLMTGLNETKQGEALRDKSAQIWSLFISNISRICTNITKNH
jgi:hypothetical protein